MSQFHSGITGKAREALAKILDHVLKDEFSLSATTRDYRWNLTGPNSYSLHRLFDEQRRQLEYWLDRLVQCTRSAGISTDGTVGDIARSNAPVTSGDALPPRSMIHDLLARHEAMADRLRDDIERLRDPVMADLLTHLLEFHETTAWMLRMLHDGAPGHTA